MKQSPPLSPPPDFALGAGTYYIAGTRGHAPLACAWDAVWCSLRARGCALAPGCTRPHDDTSHFIRNFMLEHFSFHIARPRSYISCVYRLPPVSFYRSRTMDTEPALYNSCTGVFLPVTCIAPTGAGNNTGSIPVPVGPVKTWSDHACSPPCEQTSFVQRLCEYGSHEGTNGSAARARGWTASAHAHG